MKKRRTESIFIAGFLISYIVLGTLVSVYIPSQSNSGLGPGLSGAILAFFMMPWLVYMGSVICTAGIGLAFWIPLWFITGKIFFMFYDGITGGEAVKNLSGKGDVSEIAVKNYIKEARAYKYSDEQIKDNLVGKGWAKNLVEKALSAS